MKAALGIYLNLVLLCAVFSSGCSWMTGEVQPANRSNSQGVAVSEAQEPFEFEIVEEVNDGERLHILAALSVRADWSADNVIARLVGLNRGELVAAAYYPFNTKQQAARPIGPEEGRVLRSGEKITFSVSIPALELTDYQLELFWGSEAEQHLARLSGISSPSALLKIRKVELFREPLECEQGNCPVQLTVAGELFNSGQSAVCDIEIAVGLVWIATGHSFDHSSYNPDSAGEELVKLSGLCLDVAKTKPIRFVIDRDVPDLAGGAYRPVIRIVSFQSI